MSRHRSEHSVLRFEWNALRVGDTVAVHDAADPHGALLAGTVVMIEPRRAKRGVNGVGIRVDTDGAHRIVWPSYLTAHPDAPNPSLHCWRCTALVDAALPHLAPSGTQAAARRPASSRSSAAPASMPVTAMPATTLHPASRAHRD